MSSNRRVRIVKAVLVLGIVAVGLVAAEVLTSGITPTTQAVCMAGTCGPGSPPVTCSNGASYPNICAANAACQYSCCPGPNCGGGHREIPPPIVVE